MDAHILLCGLPIQCQVLSICTSTTLPMKLAFETEKQFEQTNTSETQILSPINILSHPY